MYFIAHFKDEKVQGARLGNPDTGWKSLPDKPLTALEYVLPYGDSLVLKDYEEYFHAIATYQQVGQPPSFSDILLMGKRNGLVTSYRIAVSHPKKDDHQYKVGHITVERAKYGKEDGSPVSGWRKGHG